MKKTGKMICVLLSLALIFTVSSCGRKNTVTFGTGNTGGNYYSYGSALAQFVSRDDEKLTVDVRATAGSAANLRLIQQGFLDVAIVQSDMLMDAFSGTGEFAGKPCSGVRALAGLYTEECQVIVRDDSDIMSISDLYRRRVSVGEMESGVKKNAEQILKINGISPDMIEEQYLTFSEAASALADGSVDAAFFTAGSPTTAVTGLAKEVPVRLISLDEKTVSRLVSEDSGFTACTIPAGTYNGQDEDVNTVGVRAVLVAGNKVPDSTAEQFVKTLSDHSAEMKYSSGAPGSDIDSAVSDIPVPFHSGTAAWYASHGITVNTDADGTVGGRPNAAQD